MVIWTYSAKHKKGTSPADDDWAFKEDLYIWLPGATESDHRCIHDSEDESISGTHTLDVLNELGAEGWEMIDRETTNSAFGKSYGWIEASFPVSVARTLKRPVT